MAYNLLKGLQQTDTLNQYLIICSGEEYTKSAISSSNFRVICPPIINLSLGQRIINKIWRSFLPVIVYCQKADVYYSVHNMRLPRFRLAKRTIASNLDLIPLRFKEYGDKDLSLQQEILRTARTADHFVSISNFSKDELCKTLRVDRGRVSVIYLASDDAFNIERSKESNDSADQYMLTIGGSEPRKNVQTVIDAYSMLPMSIQSKYKLLIAGGRWHNRQLNIPSSNVIELGYVPDKELPNLYANAHAFIFASEYEGFGFSILEAMASGTPVINARGSSLDEVAGDATLTFNAHDPSELTSQIKLLLSDEKLRSLLVKKGTAQNRKFSWHKATKELHTLLISKRQ